jgi:hypothetical protein
MVLAPISSAPQLKTQQAAYIERQLMAFAQ